jgi:hypothetical protein
MKNKKNQFIITGPRDGEDQLYWNNSPTRMWVEFGEATTFPIDILSAPLPPRASGIMEVTIERIPVREYPVR